MKMYAEEHKAMNHSCDIIKSETCNRRGANENRSLIPEFLAVQVLSLIKASYIVILSLLDTNVPKSSL